MSRLKGQRAQTRLSQAALETLAIIAYKQPMLRAQLEAIRGVACGEVLKSLMERRLVKIVGRAEEVGRPMLYGTTPEFLRVFGIANLSDLPQAKDLR
jgi:segregation and condensation protein B